MADDTREVGGGDAETVCVEADVVVLFEMLGQQAEESEKDFFDTLWEAVLADALLLDGREVGEEEVVEHAQAVVGQWETHLLIVNHHLHQFAQALKIIGFQWEHGRGEFHHCEVGRTDGIAHRWQAERNMLVGQQTDAAVITGRSEDGYLEAGRIGIEVALTKRQFAIII